MPRPKKTAEELYVMRERIIDVAYELLQQDGPHGITTRAIAERLGIAHMSLYTYFPNQTAILQGIRTRETLKWDIQQQEILQRVTSDPLPEVVRALLQFMIDFPLNNPQAYRLWWIIPDIGNETPEIHRKRLHATVGYLAQVVQLGIDRGDFVRRDAFLAASVALGIVNAPFFLYFNGKLASTGLRDQMIHESLHAAMTYLCVEHAKTASPN